MPVGIPNLKGIDSREGYFWLVQSYICKTVQKKEKCEENGIYLNISNLHNAFFISELEQEAEQEDLTPSQQLATLSDKASYVYT